MNYKFNCCLVLILVLWHVQAIARAPTPHCTTHPTYKQIPLVADQLFTYDMSTTFSGYNLNITVSSKNSWADITQKWHLLDRKQDYYPGLISHYIEPKDNSVGRDSFLLYKDTAGTILLSYGIIRDKGYLPDVKSTAIVTNDKDVVCFDAALFLDHGLAIVDCAKTKGAIFTTYSNLFYIIDLTDHSLKKIVPNDMYIGFTSITKRKFLKFSHPEAGGFTYLLRSYFSDSVDALNSDNTYMQIFLVPVEDPTAIQVLRVIDRTLLNLKTLRIMDAQIYLDDIFVLDYDTGLLRLDILQSQRINIIGGYRQFGFEKFAVYSDDLQNQVLIALSNKHSVYEINWDDIQQPLVINKYSILQNSTVQNVFMNNKYVIVQVFALAYNDTHPQFQLNNTWIFSKGSRTYTNAYHIISHNSTVVQIQFDRENNHLYIADQRGITLRQISEASIILHYFQQKTPGDNETQLIIDAVSSDPNSNVTVKCQEKFKAIFLTKDNTTLWPTGLDTANIYSVNYPSPVRIPLDSYFIGPNINYQILNQKGDNLPGSWVNKINKTSIRINPVPPPQRGDTIFFHSDVKDYYGFQILIYYYQDSTYETHIAECTHIWESSHIDCKEVWAYNHSSAIYAFTSAAFMQKSQRNYYYVVVFQQNKRLAAIYDYDANKIVTYIQYVGDYEAQIHSVAHSNGFLYVLRKYAKTIDVYSFSKCASGTCVPDFSIDSKTAKALGVGYFSPQGIVTDPKHPEVLFIQCLGSLVILDIDNKQNLHLLDLIISPATLVSNFRVAVSQKRMVIVAYPNFIFEYSLQFLYTYNMVTLTKELSTQNMVLQPDADIDFSDFDSTVYVNAFDKNKNISVIMIYRTGHLATDSYYSIIELDKLYSKPGFQIEVSGGVVNFLSVATQSTFRLYRIFGSPYLVIRESKDDFSFNIKGYNKNSSLTTKEVSVSVVNREQTLTATKILNDSLNSLKAKKNGTYQWQDRQWFEGNLVDYLYFCDQCNGDNPKVKIRQHIDDYEDLNVGGYAYVQTVTGGLSVWDDLFRYRTNGSVYAVANLPDQKKLEDCRKVAAPQNEIFAVTACQQRGRGVNLYVTSFASFKSFTWGPYISGAVQVRNMQIINDIVLIADTPSNPEFLIEHGSIYLYRVSFNPESGDEMDELQIIDSNDFAAAAGWNQDQAFLSNAHLVYSGNTNAYRLYVVEARYGFFVIDFVKAHATDNQITILTTNFIDVKKLLLQNNLHFPDDACFLSISYVKSIFSPYFDTENIVITTRGYDNFEITLIFDDSGHVQAPILHRVYQRYAYYNAVNEVHAKNGFIIIGYINPFQSEDQPKQYVALYDSIDYPHEFDKGYSERYMLAGIPLNTSYAAGYAINTTYDFRTNGTRSGIVVNVAPDSQETPLLFGASISHNLSLSLQKGYKSQPISIVAFNDFSLVNFTVNIQFIPDDDGGGDDQTTIIIIIIVLSAIVFVFIVFYIFSVLKKRKPVEQRESLLTENQTLVRESVRQDLDEYQPPKVGNSINQSTTKPSQLAGQTHEEANTRSPLAQPERLIKQVNVQQVQQTKPKQTTLLGALLKQKQQEQEAPVQEEQEQGEQQEEQQQEEQEGKQSEQIGQQGVQKKTEVQNKQVVLPVAEVEDKQKSATNLIEQ